MTLDAASALLGRSVSSISRIENGKVTLPSRDLPLFLDVYKVTDPRRREALTDLARADRTSWWQQYNDVLTTYPDFISLENDATDIRAFQAIFIPGMFQHPEYAYALFAAAWPDRPSWVIKRHVAVRMARQQILLRDDPPHFHAVIWEAALRAQVGGTSTMQAQFASLRRAAELPHVTLQVLPFSSGPPLTEDGGFTILRIPAFGGDDVVHIDSAAGSSFLDAPKATSRYSLAFERRRRSALSGTESLALLEEVAGGT